MIDERRDGTDRSGRLRAGAGRRSDARWSARLIVEQPGVLEVCDRVIHGTIHDVGARGAYFSAAEQPLCGARGVLVGPSGRIPVQVVWRQVRGHAGVGLQFTR